MKLRQECEACGTENGLLSNYCRNCGQSLVPVGGKPVEERRSPKARSRWGLTLLVVALVLVVAMVVVIPRIMPMSEDEYKLKADTLADEISNCATGPASYDKLWDELNKLEARVKKLRPPHKYKESKDYLLAYLADCRHFISWVQNARNEGGFNEENTAGLGHWMEEAQRNLNAYEEVMGETLTPHFWERWQ